MAQSSLQGKMEYDVEYKASVEMIFDFWTRKLGDIPKACPEIVRNIKVLKGTWEKEGCITEWTYNLGGENKLSSKFISEKLDFENKFYIIKITDGDNLGDRFKSFKFILQMTPKYDGGSVASWTLEYEKQNESVEDPIVNREASILLNKAIDAYLAPA